MGFKTPMCDSSATPCLLGHQHVKGTPNKEQEVPNGAADRTVHLAGLLIHKLDPQSIDCIRWGPGDPEAGYREERADSRRDPSALTPTSISDIPATCESCMSPPACSNDELLSLPSWKAGVSRFFLVLDDLLGGLLKIRL